MFPHTGIVLCIIWANTPTWLVIYLSLFVIFLDFRQIPLSISVKLYYNICTVNIIFVFIYNILQVISMLYDPVLQFFCDTIKKSHIQTAFLDPDMALSAAQEIWGSLMFPPDTDRSLPLRSLLPPLREATVYRVNSIFSCTYLYFLLPERGTLLLLGPFLTDPPTNRQFLEWAEQRKLPVAQQKAMLFCLENIPIIPLSSQIFSLIDTLAEHLWGINGYTMEQVQGLLLKDSHPDWTEKEDATAKAKLWQMHLLENRYTYENELMTAVSTGQIHRAERILRGFNVGQLSQRSPSPLRSLKNYGIVFNTLMRKAAEKGGVHPLHLDETSASFAARLEQLPSPQAFTALLPEMVRTYCRLVQNHSMQQYSAPVQKAIICIETDLSADLSLRALAGMLNISSSYLSSLFKKETGESLTDFVSQRRIRQAVQLLESTHLQIQSIAQHCGFEDVQYFTKVFKKIVGVTPNSYRKSHKTTYSGPL